MILGHNLFFRKFWVNAIPRYLKTVILKFLLILQRIRSSWKNHDLCVVHMLNGICTESSSLNANFKLKTSKREDQSVQNYYLLLGYYFKSTFSFDLVTEYSNDPLVRENDYKIWPGAYVNHETNNKNTLLLFGGQRRGGISYNSGVCSKALAFEVIELRLMIGLSDM